MQDPSQRDLPSHLQELLKIEENRQRLQAIFEHSIDAIILIDDEPRFVDANPAACALIEKARAELLGKSIWQAAPDLDQEVYRKWWLNFQSSGHDEGIFKLYGPPTGPRTIEFRAAANIIPGVHLVVLRDITAKQQAEEQLRATQELLKNILDYAPTPIYATGLDGIIHLANRAWQQYMGPFRPGMTHKDLEGVLSADTVRNFSAWNQSVAEADSPLEQEEWVEKPEGRYYFHSVKFPLRSQDGKVEAVGGISIDITDRRRAELEVQASEKKFRRLVEQSADGIILGDEQGIVVEWNAAMEDLTGIPPAEAVGKPLWDTQYQSAVPEHRTQANYQRIKTSIQELLRTGKSPWLTGLWESELQHINGSRRRIQSNGFLIETERGWMVGSIVRDITRQRQVQEEINQRNRELSSLLAISQQLNGQLNLEQLIKFAVLAITDTLPQAESASLWLNREDGLSLLGHICIGKGNLNLYQVSAPVKGSLVGNIFLNTKPVYIRDYQPDSRLLPSNPMMDRIRSAIGLPLIVEGHSIGVLFAASFSRSNAFDDNDERWLQSLAGHVAVMIENARLFEQINAGRERQQALSRQLVEVQEAERRRIARELHDEVGQILTGLKLLLKMTASATGEEASKNLQEAQQLTNDLLSRVHDLSLDLRPAMLDDLGLLPALLWHIDRFTAQTGVVVHFRHQGLEGVRFPPEVETGAYRIIQEALTNVARYAGTGEVSVRAYAAETELCLEVEDRGAGFNAADQLANKEKAGLNGMRERALLVGGNFSIVSQPGYGTLLRSILPLNRGFIE